MALDGIVIAGLVHEFRETLLNGRINKINQPESDELILVIKNNREQIRLLLSANPSLPLAYLTQNNKPNPMTAPNFCMLLRKHLNSAKILDITQPEFERIIDFTIEHLNELGDVCIKHLIIELMGKHSNIIFCDDSYVIVDSIKHISGFVSSVREVLPGRNYFIPKTMEKFDPRTIVLEDFSKNLLHKAQPLDKALYNMMTGISPLVANEICHRSSLDPGISSSSLTETHVIHLYKNFQRCMEDITNNHFEHNIVFHEEEPVEFSSINLSCYSSKTSQSFESISELLENYYFTKTTLSRIKQKSTDIRKIITNALARGYKKLDLQTRQLEDTQKKDKYKVYGELITTYGYSVTQGEKNMTTTNFYTGEEITIPLDPTITPIENAKKYFDKYSKLKRTFEALSLQIIETKEEIDHLESILSSLDMARLETDLADIKHELVDFGYMKRKFTPGKKNKKEPKNPNKPLHFLSSDGFHIYVGKNNYQNDELTFKFATGGDWWFHAKGMAGSHVILKTDSREIPDRTFEEAGKLAGYYSKAFGMEKAEIDYVERKHIKKPNKAKPGFVIYHTNYSLIVKPDITGIAQITDI